MAKARILLVERRTDVGPILSQTLENSGYVLVGIVASGTEAIQQAGAFQPDLVLMSVHEHDNDDLAQTATSIEKTYGIPVIILASAENIPVLQQTDIVGPIQYMAKPFVMADLDASISTTLQKQEARQQLEQTSLGLANALMSTDDAMIMVDAEGRVKSMNPTAEKMTGCQQSEALGKPLDEIVVVLDANTGEPQSNPAMEALRESETLYTTTCCTIVPAKYGTPVPLYQSATPIRDEQGAVSGVVWVFRNVLEHRTAEAQIAHRLTMEEAVTRVSRQFMSPEDVNLSAVLGSLAEASCANSAAIFRFDDGSHKARATCSWKDGGIVAHTTEDRALDMTLYPWWMHQLECGEDVLIPEVSALPEAAHAEMTMLRARSVGSLLSVPIYSTEGALLGFMCFEKPLNQWEGILEDARLLRLVAETIGTYWGYRQLRAALRESDKLAATGPMVARIAHEINNPLAGILHAFLLVKDGIPVDHPYRDYVPLIEGEIERLANIVRQMLQLHAPHDEIPCPLSVAQALNDVATLSTTLARERHVTIHVEDCDDIGPVTLPEGALRQVLINLTRNAIEASPEDGEVRLRAVVHGDRLKIYVVDQGHGIPDKIRPSIFEPFFTTKKGQKDSGLGLGLSISQGLAGSMRGTLGARSKPRQGTEFWLDVPIQKTEGKQSHGC